MGGLTVIVETLKCAPALRPRRLVRPRTPDFRSDNRGSNPLGVSQNWKPEQPLVARVFSWSLKVLLADTGKVLRNKGEKSICWQALFHRWPDSIPELGIAVTSLNESITFSNFQVSDEAVLFERDRPDTMGARSAIVPWGEIVTVKLTSSIESAQFRNMGFKPVGKVG